MGSELRSKEEFLDFLGSWINYERDRDRGLKKESYRLTFMKSFVDLVGHPERNWKLIHIAGTNGKGSLSHILSHILFSGGLNIGLYTSPHIRKINERIMFNNEPIDDEMLIQLGNRFKDLIQDISWAPSFFDVMTSLAILYFMEKRCDYIILEVGLGGRLDSTNFSDDWEFKLAMINTIALDHIEQLGGTVEEIAKEKMGIVYLGNQLIFGEQEKYIYPLLENLAIAKGVKYFKYSKDFVIDHIEILEDGIGLNYRGLDIKKPLRIESSLLSVEQSVNIGMALLALEVLKISFEGSWINQILRGYILPGRFQRYQDFSPIIILDGGHNPDAMGRLRWNLDQRYEGIQEKILMIGISKGKDYRGILERILDFFDQVIVCKLPVLIKEDISRDIFNFAKGKHSRVIYQSSFEEGYRYLMEELPEEKDRLVVISGSFYLIGSAISHLETLKI